MSESQGSTPKDQTDRGMTLANMITDAVNKRTSRGATWLSENSIDPATGKRVYTSRSSTNRIMTQPNPTEILTPSAIRAFSASLGISHQALLEASAISAGLDVGRNPGQFARSLPTEIDDLSLQAREAIRGVALALARAEGLIT